MRLELQPAYVLHSRPYRETSLLVECLTRDQGRLGVVARGVRGEKTRLRRAQLEPFQPLAMGLLLRGELATLTSVETTGTPLRLIGNAGLAGLYLNELVVRLSERQDPSSTLFDAYALALQRLATDESLAWSLRRFERDLLQAMGYALQLEHDAETGELLEPQAHYEYRVEQGAVACLPGRRQSVARFGHRSILHRERRFASRLDRSQRKDERGEVDGVVPVFAGSCANHRLRHGPERRQSHSER